MKRRKNLLPTNYVAARQALAACTRVDECKRWADKALALASYAKQINDPSLEAMAQRIRNRAVERGGELLEQVKPARGGDRGNAATGGRPPFASRKAAAEAAGLSQHQAKEMLRVAKVPKDQFEEMTERAKPATIEELAEIGKRKTERIRPEPHRAEWIDWTNAVRHLAALPGCGLDALAARRPADAPRLIEECAAAIDNLNLWRSRLGGINVGTKSKIKAA